MKKFTFLFVFMAFALMVFGQSKLTPQAQIAVVKKQMQYEKKAAQAKAKNVAAKEPRITLVVKVANEGARETYDQLRKAGAEIEGKIGRQAVISLPLQNVQLVDALDGVERIDINHKPQMKTDVTIRETGTNMIDGSEGSKYSYTGKGVTVCVLDAGFDYQHAAFKDAEGRSRIKCVYLMDKEDGHKFSYEDEIAGTIKVKGSIYDTPEMIGKLITDDLFESHGTHTAGIAAGTRTPMGFGGMAPDADIILIPVKGVGSCLKSPDIDDDDDDDDSEASVVQALAFATAYAKANNLKMVVNGSINSHDGPHDGTGSVTEALADASYEVIPVFSSGNEADRDMHVYKKFSAEDNVMNLKLPMLTSEDSVIAFSGCNRGSFPKKAEFVMQLSIMDEDTETTLWKSGQLLCKASSPSPSKMTISNLMDNDLAKYFTGQIVLCGGKDEGSFSMLMGISGKPVKDDVYFILTVTSTDDFDIDLWMNSPNGFGYVEKPGFVKADNLLSGGDWTTTNRVISVGAYCANDYERTYTGSPSEDYFIEKYYFTLNDIAYFSSYGDFPCGVKQPTVIAPGVYIVSSVSKFTIDDLSSVAESMKFNGSAYTALTGSSMSCPVVSGIIASWLQADPTLTFDDVVEVLKNSCTEDKYTTAAPIKSGFGKINALKGLEYILNRMPGNADGISNVNADSKKNADVIYDLQGRRVLHPTNGIYVKGGKKFVVK